MNEHLNFSNAGKVLSASERIKAAKQKGVCPGCGIQTHKHSGSVVHKTKGLSNHEVYNGICIACFPDAVPKAVAQTYKQEQKESSRLKFQLFQNSRISNLSCESDTQQDKVHLPTSARQRVMESWQLVQNDLGSLGMEFFTAIFQKHPYLKELFHFGNLSEAGVKDSKLLRAHAAGVMKTIGNSLGGLSDMETLVPRLRQLGRMHSLIGVQPADFDKMHPILINCIRRKVGPEKWSNETQQAWETCFHAVTAVMKDPSRHLHVEPPEGWGLWCAIVSIYLAIVTPLQLAGFGKMWLLQALCVCANTAAFLTCAVDWGSEPLQQMNQLKSVAARRRLPAAFQEFLGSDAWFYFKFRLNRMLLKAQFNRFSPWLRLDECIITSFILQTILKGWIPTTLWFAIGLARLFSISRVVHFATCAELIALKKKLIRIDHLQHVSLLRVAVVMMYILHVFACMHVMVIQVSDEGTNTDCIYAPVLRPMLSSARTPAEMWNAYLQAFYWAFVSMTGMGWVHSVPESSIEIGFNIMVHAVGAASYAIAAGSVYTILESRARSFNKIQANVSALTEFMQQCEIPNQEKFLSSYLLTNLADDHRQACPEATNATRPLLPEAADSLPHHLHTELTLFSRAKAIRDRGIPSASVDFSFVLAESLVERLTLLSGDFLFKSGEKITRRVWMVDKGVLEIFVDGVSKGSLVPGDIIGLGWLATAPMDSKETLRHKAYVDWMSLEGFAIADVRAMDSCRLVLGLTSKKEVMDLRKMHTEDMLKLQKTMENGEDYEWDHVRLLQTSAATSTHQQQRKPQQRRGGFRRSFSQQKQAEEEFAKQQVQRQQKERVPDLDPSLLLRDSQPRLRSSSASESSSVM